MSKIEFRKVAKDDWLNIFAVTGLHLIAGNNQYSSFEVARLDKIVRLFTRDYLKHNYEQLKGQFDMGTEESEQLLRAFESFVSALPQMRKSMAR